MNPTLHTYVRRVFGRRPNGARQTLDPADAYDRWAASYRSRMNPVQELEEEALLSLLPDLAGRAVLDVGCGTGRIARIALDRGARSTVGVDVSRAMIDRARAQGDPRSRWIVGDTCSLPLPAASFDVAISALVLGHVEPLEHALSEMHRVLKVDGTILISGFHPFATLHGWERTFEDGASGRTFAIRQFVHLFQDYFRFFRAHGWALEGFEEPLYDGFPVVFVLRARKAGPEGVAEGTNA